MSAGATCDTTHSAASNVTSPAKGTSSRRHTSVFRQIRARFSFGKRSSITPENRPQNKADAGHVGRGGRGEDQQQQQQISSLASVAPSSPPRPHLTLETSLSPRHHRHPPDWPLQTPESEPVETKEAEISTAVIAAPVAPANPETNKHHAASAEPGLLTCLSLRGRETLDKRNSRLLSDAEYLMLDDIDEHGTDQVAAPDANVASPTDMPSADTKRKTRKRDRFSLSFSAASSISETSGPARRKSVPYVPQHAAADHARTLDGTQNVWIPSSSGNSSRHAFANHRRGSTGGQTAIADVGNGGGHVARHRDGATREATHVSAPGARGPAGAEPRSLRHMSWAPGGEQIVSPLSATSARDSKGPFFRDPRALSPLTPNAPRSFSPVADTLPTTPAYTIVDGASRLTDDSDEPNAGIPAETLTTTPAITPDGSSGATLHGGEVKSPKGARKQPELVVDGDTSGEGNDYQRFLEDAAARERAHREQSWTTTRLAAHDGGGFAYTTNAGLETTTHWRRSLQPMAVRMTTVNEAGAARTSWAGSREEETVPRSKVRPRSGLGKRISQYFRPTRESGVWE